MKHLIASILILLSSSTFAQNKGQTDQPDYPQDYFRNPLDIPIFLAGNFGECRPGHFHSGIDIKTLGKENQPVHAAADGYISRIKMDKTGFGHGLYITHPNGYTTLYAHLNDFAPAIQQYLKKEQYQKKHWDIDIQLTPDQFPVKKGDQIAWSGNTGASTAPHLHFEIRNTKTEHPLNPELFGLPIIDKTPPLPAEVVIYGQYKYSEGFYGDGTSRDVYSLNKENEMYTLRERESRYSGHILFGDTLVLTEPGNVGIGVNVDDHMDGSENTIAFYTAKLSFDDSLQSEITLDDIGYDDTRYVNAYADYKIKELNNKWVQCFFKLPGNHLDKIYSNLNRNYGRLIWNDERPHKVSIIITDDKENKSEILFYVRSEMKLGPMMAIRYPEVMSKFFPNTVNSYDGQDMRFLLNSNALYDKVLFVPKTTKFDSGYSDKHKVLESYIPAHSYFDLAIKSNKTVPHLMTDKVVMMYSDGKDEDGRAALAIDSGWYRAKVRSFGTYWLDIDTTPPVIKSEQKNGANLSKAKQITFEVKDNKTSVKKFSGYLAGKWICFEQHNDLFFYKFDEHCPKGKHQLIFSAEDENNNVSDYHLNFVR